MRPDLLADSRVDAGTGTTVGVIGRRARWTVSPWGAVTRWGAETTLDWFVAAEDRWHVPPRESTVRQMRLGGTPVVETRLRVPDGDLVQRVWAVPDAGGTLVIEFENESPRPLAVALSGPPVVTERPPSDVPVRGIDLPGPAIVLPIGQRSVVRMAMAGGEASLRPEHLGRLAPASTVVGGWHRVVEQASRLDLPDDRLVEAVIAARCDLLLEGPVDRVDDPLGFLLDAGELVRCGDDADAWLPEIVPPAEAVSRHAGKRSTPGSSQLDIIHALHAARLVAGEAGDRRAGTDVDRAIARIVDGRDPSELVPPVTSFADLRRSTSAGRFVRSVERRVVDLGRLLCGGLPTAWHGVNFEVHDLPTSGSTSLSFALRWHGARPAILWEQHGSGPIHLTAPDIDGGWASDERSGEALWPAPEGPGRRGPSLTVGGGGGGGAVGRT